MACCKFFNIYRFNPELSRTQIVIGLFVAFGGVLFGYVADSYIWKQKLIFPQI